MLVKSLKDEFKLDEIKARKIPAEARQELVKNNSNECSESENKTCRRGVGKLLHLMRFNHPESVNATRELSKFMTSGTSKAHTKSMLEEMKYIVETPDRGCYMKTNIICDGNPEFKIFI